MTAKMLFIGEAPGQEEDRLGVPFIGPAGQLLNRALHTVGIPRSEVLVTNLFCQRPPANDVGYFYEDKKQTKLTWEGEEHVAQLKEWLEKILETRESTGEGPNIICALGVPAMKVLTGKLQIKKWRGSVLPCTLVPGFKVYATYHPSHINRLMNEKREALVGEEKKQQQNLFPIFLKDLQRVQIQSEYPLFLPPQRTYKIIDSIGEALAALDAINGAASCVSVDIETLKGPEGPFLWYIGFSATPEYGFTFPFIKNKLPCWTEQEEAMLIAKISEFFLNPEIKKVFHNGSYDLSILGRYYGLRIADGAFDDTMLCHHASYPYLDKGLAVCTSIYTWEPYYKDDGKVWEGKRVSDQEEGIYNCKDVCVTREIMPILERDALELGTYKGYQRTTDCFPSILGMQIRGVKIDLAKKAQLTVEFSKRATEAQNTVNDFFPGENYNINSPQQMTLLLYSKLNLPIQYNNETKRPSADKDAINKLLRKVKRGSKEHGILKAISEFKKFDKLRSTYTEMEIDVDGRVRTGYGWISTYRLSSSESHFGGGGNLQNIPVRSEEGKLIRSLFVPDEGKELLAADLEQAEAREVAWMANDRRLIEWFKTPGFDVHWQRAKTIFKIPEGVHYLKEALYKSIYLEQEEKLELFRRIGKTVVHAFNYRMGAFKLQTILMREGIYIPINICKELLEQVKRENPLTVQWQNRVIEDVRATRCITTPLGRKRYFMGRLDDELYRSAIAFAPQSTVGELLQMSIRDISRSCTKFDHLLNVHDEVVGQGKPEDREENIRILRPLLEISHEINGREIIIPCAFKYGPNWGEMREIKNG
jgi:uracil-DNA glycosylase family 4